MHILILASSAENADQVRARLDDVADRFSVTTNWPDIFPVLEKDRPDLIFVERATLTRIDLATLSKLAQPGRVPPVLLASLSGSGVLEGIQAIRHLVEGTPHFYQVGSLRIDTRRKRAGIEGHWVALPPIQYRLLLTLAKRAGEVVDYQELLQSVWGYEAGETEARELVKVHIRQIRRRLGLRPERHNYIRSVRGFGYMLTPPEDEEDQD